MTIKKTVMILSAVCLLGSVAWPAGSARAGEPVRVLFIGNSLTSSHDIPRQIAGMAQSSGINMAYEMYAPGGYSFADHARDPRLLKNIKEQQWDIVVLQEQGQRLGFGQAQVKNESLAPVSEICRLVRETSPKARIVFYQTMARRDGDKRNEDSFPAMATYSGMQDRINSGYEWVAGENQAEIAPVGEVWRKIREEHPKLNLYSDEIHPNETGAYLAAGVLCATFFEVSPFEFPVPSKVHPKAVELIQEAVYRLRF